MEKVRENQGEKRYMQSSGNIWADWQNAVECSWWPLSCLQEHPDRCCTCSAWLCIGCVTNGASPAPVGLDVSGTPHTSLGLGLGAAELDVSVVSEFQPCQSCAGGSSAVPPALAPSHPALLWSHRAMLWGTPPWEPPGDLECWNCGAGILCQAFSELLCLWACGRWIPLPEQAVLRLP